MSYFKVSYLLENTDIPPFVLGAFFSRSTLDSNYIYAEAASNAGTKPDESTVKKFEDNKRIYLDKLNKVSAPFEWEFVNENSKAFKARLIIENDLNLDKEKFFFKLYYKLVTKYPWMTVDNLNEEKKSFIRGYFETRGSVDVTANYLAQDYFSDGKFELKKYKLLTDFCDVPYYVSNLNFRDLQKQFYEDINPRNTQFRLNLKWYMKNIGIIDDFKADKFATRFTKEYSIIKKRTSYIL